MSKAKPIAILVLLLVTAPALAGDLEVAAEVHLADIRQLTFGGENAEAYWSFDGRRLSFQSTQPPYECDQIFTFSPFEDDDPVLVSSGAGRTTCAHYLLGDERLIWAATDDYASECPPSPDYSKGYVWPIDPDYELYTANADGSDKLRLTENRVYDAEATVCATDGAIVFTSTRDGDLDLYRMDADGSNVKRLTEAPGYDGGAFFSADCTQLVWRASRPQGAELEEYRALLAENLIRPGKLELWVANADGTEARQITDLGVASFAPFFYPDGQRLIFSSNYGDPRGREFDLWAIDTDGSNLERITHSEGFDGFPMFSPDGSHLVFASNRNQGKPGETNLFLARWTHAPVTRTVERGADRFAADAAWLAADEREGRDVGFDGLAEAGAWLEDRFRELGFSPAGDDGGYRQEFLVEVAVRAAAGTALTIAGSEIAADQFVPTASSTAGPVEAEVVAAGWGITSEEKEYDDYAGVEVDGKIVLVRRFVPPGEAFEGADSERRWGDLRYKAFNAREHGAVGLIVVDLEPLGPTDPDDPHAGEEAPLPRLRPDSGGDVGIPVVVATRAAVAALEEGDSARIQVALEHDKLPAFNVAARLEPGGEAIDERVIVVGAHYDHLGRGGPSSLEPESREVHNGADDNASGVSAVLEAARTLAARKQELRRAVLFVAFAGEERGLLGSSEFAKRPPAGLSTEKILAMLNLDMVGRLRNETLTIFGFETAAEWKEMLPALCEELRLECREKGDGYGPSDHTAFYAAGSPVLHLFTGTHEQYHRPADDARLLNATGGAKVATFVSRVVAGLAAREQPLTLQQTTSEPPARGDVRSFGASLGTIPDYSAAESGVAGMLLSGVRPDGPAARAGMKRGDLLVGLSGKEIRSIQDLMFILRQSHPGDETTAVVVRDGERVELTVVFGEARRRM